AVAAAARANLRDAGVETADAAAPGVVRVVAGDGAAPPPGPYDRVIFTAGCWSLPAAVVDGLADGGVLVAPLRRRAARRRRDPVRIPADAQRRRRAPVALAARRRRYRDRRRRPRRR